MAKVPEHTFCVAAYGESPYLDACLRSICAQSVVSKVIICTSTPNSFICNLAAAYGADYQINKKKSGIGSDWNFAYQSATSSYVTIAHQDDIYCAEYTERCLEVMNKKNDLLMLFTDYAQLINGKTYRWRPVVLVKRLLVLPFWIFPYIKSPFWKKFVFLFGNPVSCPSVILNKQMLSEDFCFNENMKTNLDWDAWLMLAQKKGGIFRVSMPLVYHRIHGDSATSKTIKDNVRMIEDQLMFEKLWGKNFAGIIMFLYRLSYWVNNLNIK